MLKLTGALSIALVLMLQENCRDYTKDGDDGTSPQGAEPAAHQKSLHVDNAPSIPLRCNAIHRIRATALDVPQACAGYDFTTLWREADGEARSRSEALQCPQQDCRDLKTWREWQSWNCTTSSAGAVSATATVSWAAACPREGPDGITIPDSVRRPTAAQLTGPSPNPATAPVVGQSVETTAPTARKVGCAPPQIVAFHLRAGSANRPDSLERWVDQAEAEARAYHGAIQCAEGCRKTPFKADRVTWSWNNGTIAVDVFFVACR